MADIDALDFNDTTQEPIDGGRPAKRRRVLACDTCRRLKNRCEYDPALRSCSRCKRLRLECSLKPLDGDVVDVGHDTNNVLEEKLLEHTQLLQEIREIVSRIESTSTSPAHRHVTHDGPSTPHQHGTIKDDASTPPNATAADRNTTSAPVNVIRNRFSTLAGLARLSRNTKDIVELGLVSERTALHLQELFFQRVGPWIGINNWNAISEARDVRRISPLLFAAICLQGGRHDPSFCNTQQHDQLYEHVRMLTGRELLISPLPLESVCALLIVGIWSTSPKEKAEFIDSWLVSGYAVQHAKLTINFTTLLKNMNEGRADHIDQRRLRLWNSICLCHLQFSVGTGRPSVIADDYLEHCPAILNSMDATLFDGITVATVQLFAIVQDLLKHNNLTEESSRRPVKAWTAKWGHLLDAQDSRICVLQMSIDFCHLVIDRRCLDYYSQRPPALLMQHEETTQTSSPVANNDVSPSTPHWRGVNLPIHSPDTSSSTTSHPLSHTATNSSYHEHIRNRNNSTSHPSGINIQQHRTRYFILTRSHAQNLLRTFTALPLSTTEELPEFLHLCIVYAMIVLAELSKEQRAQQPDSEISAGTSASLTINSEDQDLIRQTLEHGTRATGHGGGTGISFEVTRAALGDFLGGKPDSRTEPRRSDMPQQQHHHHHHHQQQRQQHGIPSNEHNQVDHYPPQYTHHQTRFEAVNQSPEDPHTINDGTAPNMGYLQPESQSYSSSYTTNVQQPQYMNSSTSMTTGVAAGAAAGAGGGGTTDFWDGSLSSFPQLEDIFTGAFADGFGRYYG